MGSKAVPTFNQAAASQHEEDTSYGQTCEERQSPQATKNLSAKERNVGVATAEVSSSRTWAAIERRDRVLDARILGPAGVFDRHHVNAVVAGLEPGSRGDGSGNDQGSAWLDRKVVPSRGRKKCAVSIINLPEIRPFRLATYSSCSRTG